MIISDAHFLELADGENAVPGMLFRFARVGKGKFACERSERRQRVRHRNSRPNGLLFANCRPARPSRALALSAGSASKSLKPSSIGRSAALPANIDAAVNFDDLRKLAKRRLPKIAYDFIEGGLEDEDGIARN